MNSDLQMKEQTKPIKVLLAKTSMDGHWRGIAVVSKTLRDAGMEVVYCGVLSASQIIATAMQEDTDVIGLNIGGGYGVAEELMQLLAKEKDYKPLVVAGGTVPPADIPLFKQMGVSEVFPPGSRLDSIVDYIRSMVKAKIYS